MLAKIIKFYADWCGPCRVLSKNFEKVDLGNVVLEEIDAEENLDMTKEYGVRNLPTVLFIDENGEVLEKVTGLMTPQDITNKIQKYNG